MTSTGAGRGGRSLRKVSAGSSRASTACASRYPRCRSVPGAATSSLRHSVHRRRCACGGSGSGWRAAVTRGRCSSERAATASSGEQQRAGADWAQRAPATARRAHPRARVLAQQVRLLLQVAALAPAAQHGRGAAGGGRRRRGAPKRAPQPRLPEDGHHQHPREALHGGRGAPAAAAPSSPGGHHGLQQRRGAGKKGWSGRPSGRERRRRRRVAARRQKGLPDAALPALNAAVAMCTRSGVPGGGGRPGGAGRAPARSSGAALGPARDGDGM